MRRGKKIRICPIPGLFNSSIRISFLPLSLSLSLFSARAGKKIYCRREDLLKTYSSQPVQIGLFSFILATVGMEGKKENMEAPPSQQTRACYAAKRGKIEGLIVVLIICLYKYGVCTAYNIIRLPLPPRSRCILNMLCLSISSPCAFLQGNSPAPSARRRGQP